MCIRDSYIISINKIRLTEQLKKYNISISNEYFYSVQELLNIMGTYNIQSFSDQTFLEEWLIYEIVIPLNHFILHIRDSVRDPSDEIEVYEKLREYLIPDINDKNTLKEFKSLCKYLAPFWKFID